MPRPCLPHKCTWQELGAHYILASALLAKTLDINQFYFIVGSSSHWVTCSFAITLPHPHTPKLSSYGSTLDRNKERPWTSFCSELFPAFLFCSMNQWIGESPDYSVSFRFFGCTLQLINSRRPGRILSLAYASQEGDNIFLYCVRSIFTISRRSLLEQNAAGFFQCSICSCATNLCLLFILFSMICLCVFCAAWLWKTRGTRVHKKKHRHSVQHKQTVVFFHISLSFLTE